MVDDMFLYQVNVGSLDIFDKQINEQRKRDNNNTKKKAQPIWKGRKTALLCFEKYKSRHHQYLKHDDWAGAALSLSYFVQHTQKKK